MDFTDAGFVQAALAFLEANKEVFPDAYARAWRETFAARIRASSLFAALTVPPLPSRASIAVLQRSPAVLTWGARWSGKARIPQPRAA